MSSSTAAAYGSSTVAGNFAATSSLSIRWTKQAKHVLAIPYAQLNITWHDVASGTARIAVQANLTYAGLKETGWLEMRVNHNALPVGITSSSIKLISANGDGVLSAELVNSKDTPSVSPPRKKPAPFGRLAPEPNSAQSTPTPRRRTSTRISSAPRPPSFTNLFEQTMPLAPKLDLVSVARDAPAASAKPKLSLLDQDPPFEGESIADMTFEAAVDQMTGDLPSEQTQVLSTTPPSGLEDNRNSPASASPEAPEADSDLPIGSPHPPQIIDYSIVRVQVDLGQLLAQDKPHVNMVVLIEFPQDILRTSLSTATSLTLALPSFSIIGARREISVVSVGASDDDRVELATSNASLHRVEKADQSLPVQGEQLRWTTERDESIGNAANNELVGIRIRRRDHFMTDALGDVVDSPSPAARMLRRQTSAQFLRTASTLSLRSKPSLSNVGLSSSSDHVPQVAIEQLKLRLTPVPPANKDEDWRVMSHLTFNRPFSGTFELPLSSHQRADVVESWNANGEATQVETQHDQATGSKKLRVETINTPNSDPHDTCGSEGVNELLYCVSTPEKNGRLNIGDVLPQMNVKVGSLEVEVVPVAGRSCPRCSLLDNC